MARFARGSRPWLATPLLVALAVVALGGALQSQLVVALSILPLLVFFFFVVFFRDPERPIADGIASPADGRVTEVSERDDPDVGRASRLCIFMSPADVHVNRFPVDGKVLSVTRVKGGYIPAFNKESDQNERVATVIQMADGTKVKVVQIAGTVARRIVPYVSGAETVAKGERLGLIRLGSRCDLYVPADRAQWMAKPGDRVFAGATSLGELKAKGGA